MTQTPPTEVAEVADVFAALPPALDLKHYGPISLITQIREDLKLAVKLGLFPKGTRFSVRKNIDAGSSRTMGSITVSIATWRGAVYSDAYLEARLDGNYKGMSSQQRYSPAFLAALDFAERIANRHNHNVSYVGYYLNVHGGTAEAVANEALKEETVHSNREDCTVALDADIASAVARSSARIDARGKP